MGVYLPTIPQSTDFLSVSQGKIKSNFTLLNSIFGTDHVPLDVNTATQPSGYHQIIHMVSQNNPPTKNTFGILYSKQIASINSTGLIYKDGPPSGNGTNRGISYCQSETISLASGAKYNIPAIVGNVSGIINFVYSLGSGHTLSSMYTYSFFQNVANSPILMQKLTQLTTNLAPGVIIWSSASPSNTVTLQLFNNDPTYTQSFYYSAIFTYTQ